MASRFSSQHFETRRSASLRGAGGVFTEVLQDVVLRRGPIDERVAEKIRRALPVVQSMIQFNPDTSTTGVVRFIAAFSRLAASAPW
jgi:chloramphenicol 3-O-phosphotransferase